MSKEFCCKALQLLIENPECPIDYITYQREYDIAVPWHYLKKNSYSMNYRIRHCPCCGTEFPKDLSNEWFEIIEEKFGITGMFDPRVNKLPKEFKTDQWWKKRGL